MCCIILYLEIIFKNIEGIKRFWQCQTAFCVSLVPHDFEDAIFFLGGEGREEQDARDSTRASLSKRQRQPNSGQRDKA